MLPIRGVYISAALIVAITTAHFPSLSSSFQSDDFKWLKLAEWSSVLHSFVGTWGHGVAYRPLSRLSFYLDWRLFHFWAPGWHAENLVLDAVCSWGVYLVAGRLGIAAVPSFLAAVLFSVSPLGRENVDWISGRTGLLSLAFLLAALLSWLAYCRTETPWKVIATAGLYILALLSYEPSLVLPALLLCFGVEKKRHLVAIGLLALLGAAFWIIRARLVGSLGTDVDPLYADLGTAVRLNAEPLFRQMRHAWGYGGLALLATAAVIAVRASRTRFLACGLITASFIFYLPYIMVVGVAPRFLFMSQAPLSILLVLPFSATSATLRRTLTAACLCLLLFFGWTTNRHARDRSNRTVNESLQNSI